MVLPIEPKTGSQTTTPPDKQTSQSVAEAALHNALVTPDESVVLEASQTPTGIEASGATGASGKSESISDVNASSADGPDHTQSTDQALVTSSHLPDSIVSGLPLFMGNDGIPYMQILGKSNPHVTPIEGIQASRTLRRLARKKGIILKAREIKDIIDELVADAEDSDDIRDVWYRVAQIQDGLEIDVGDKNHTRIRIMPGKVEIITEGSKTLFFQTPSMRPFFMPAEKGDLNLINKYSNLHLASNVLLKAWLSYTLAHPKAPATSFVFLVLHGDQGSGKTFLCKLIQTLIDPSIVGVQTFPRNDKDLAIAAKNAHVLSFDNIRNISPAMSDKLCVAATGGHMTTRQLFTDADQHVQWLHVAIVFNGIHDFIDQSDLAHRCMPLHLPTFNEKDRRSESQLLSEFQTDLPMIFRGLLDLIADILTHLPSVEVTNPERMIDFVHWLAAMEKVDGAPSGVYQAQYSDALKEGMLDSLLEDPLASAVMSFTEENVEASWSGKPSELLQELNFLVGNRSRSSRDWPQTASALSKRLRPLQVGLRRQGIEIKFSRAKHRNITISNMEAF